MALLKNQFQPLKGKGLIALPYLKDPLFEQSICYICQNDQEGALGFVINKPTDMREKDLLEDQDLEIIGKFERPILNGGPVHLNRGFVLHNHGNKWKNTLKIKDELYITTSQEILAAIAAGEIIDNYFIALGYAAWKPGQLEEEVAKNDWLICDITPELLFHIPFEQRWAVAMHQIGIHNPLYLVDISGHA